MEIICKLNSCSSTYVFFGGTVGLIFGSLITSMSYRIPIILEISWKEQINEFLGSNQKEYTETKSRLETRYCKLSLWTPRSHCPGCGNALLAYQLIPVVSYLILRGRCGHCNDKINIRYPLIEILTSLLSAYIFYHYKLTLEALAFFSFIFFSLTLSLIDIENKILPNMLVFPLLWLGILFNISGQITSLEEAVLGVIFGYIFLWTIARVYKLFSGKDGIGQGDIKLLAALGGWVGLSLLPFLIILAASGGIIGGLIVKLTQSIKSPSIAFGPYLCASGLIVTMYDKSIYNLLQKISP